MLNQSNVKKEKVEEKSTCSSKQMYIQSPMTTRNEIRGYLRKSKRSINTTSQLKNQHEISSHPSNDSTHTLDENASNKVTDVKKVSKLANQSKNDPSPVSEKINDQISNTKHETKT